MLIDVEGDILDCSYKYIAHQCNCVSVGAGGLAYDLFNKFPYADIYSVRQGFNKEELPLAGQECGNIIICGSEKKERKIINLMSQFYPGRPTTSGKDSEAMRLVYFKECLDKIKSIENLESIAFPYKIGSGLGGGDWSKYRKLISDFADDLELECEVYIIRRQGD